jgi:branched-chain amino acid transport system ATP-binding protein
LFNCLSRLYRPAEGDIRLNGRNLRRSEPSDIAALGIGRTFQSPILIASMSVATMDSSAMMAKVGAAARPAS